jgi:hypothetical protein
MVERMTGHSQTSTNGRDLDNGTALTFRIHLSEDAKSFLGYVNRTPEIGFELVAGVGVGNSFHISHQAVSGIVDHNVDLMESVQSLMKCCAYIVLTCHIELDSEYGRAVW